MRVLVLTQYFWPETFIINDLVAGLAERGCAVEVLTGMPNYPSGRFAPGYGGWRPRRDQYHGIPVLRVPLIPRRQDRVSLALNYVSFALSASVFGSALLRQRFDAILVYQPSPVTVGIPALILKRWRAGRLLFWVQDLWPESVTATQGAQSPLVLAPLRWLVRRIYRGSDRVLISSRGFAESVVSHGADPARVRYVPNTVEDFYGPRDVAAAAPERAELPPDGFRIVYGGNIGAAQDFATVLAAAEATRAQQHIHWVLIGDGRLREQVAAEVVRRRLAGTVHLLGRRPPAAMPTYFALADALLVTLRSHPIFALTVPSKLQAYLASGRPILAGLDGEAARLVSAAGAGLACGAGNPAALAAAAIALADKAPAERAAMGHAARALFEQDFARERVLDRLVACLHEPA